MNWTLLLTPIVVALGFAMNIYVNNKNGTVSSQQGIIIIYKEQIEAQKVKLEAMEVRITEQGNKISTLEQANKEKDTKLAEYLSIFQGRDSQSIELLSLVKANGEFIKSISTNVTLQQQNIATLTEILRRGTPIQSSTSIPAVNASVEGNVKLTPQ